MHNHRAGQKGAQAITTKIQYNTPNRCQFHLFMALLDGADCTTSEILNATLQQKSRTFLRGRFSTFECEFISGSFFPKPKWDQSEGDQTHSKALSFPNEVPNFSSYFFRKTWNTFGKSLRLISRFGSFCHFKTWNSLKMSSSSGWGFSFSSIRNAVNKVWNAEFYARFLLQLRSATCPANDNSCKSSLKCWI